MHDADEATEIAALRVCVRFVQRGVRQASRHGLVGESSPNFRFAVRAKVIDESIVQMVHGVHCDEGAELLETHQIRRLGGAPILIAILPHFLMARIDGSHIFQPRTLDRKAEQLQPRKHVFQRPNESKLVWRKVFVIVTVIVVVNLVGSHTLAISRLEQCPVIATPGVFAPIKSHARKIQ